MPFEFFPITAGYSNALLVAIMPHISDIAQKLDLPTPQPVTQAEVRRFNCFPRSDHIGGRLILTNNCEFIFDHGRVENFVSPLSYFYLQNPDLIPRFYGPVKLSEQDALGIARSAIEKLGYTEAMLSADRPPEITPPIRDGTHYIARYRIRWYDPARGGNPNTQLTSAEFEINATTGQIQMMNIRNPNTYRPDPKLSVQPLVYKRMGSEAGGTPLGRGWKTYPVSSNYARAFLDAILPQLSEYVRVAGFSVRLPITINDVDTAHYDCSLEENETVCVFLDLKNKDHFVYRHGQVIALYAHDAMDLPDRKRAYTYPEIDRDRAKFYGPINMTTNDAVALVRQAIRRLGYSEKMLHVNQWPQISGPGWWGTNRMARCFIDWRESIDGPTWVNSEVDMAAKRITSLYINDHAITNIWRLPPKISVDMGSSGPHSNSPAN